MATARVSEDRPAEVDGVEIEVSGLEATVASVRRGGAVATRGAKRSVLAGALGAHDASVDHRVELKRIRSAAPKAGGQRGARRRAAGGPAVTVRVPAPGAGREQVVLARDEHGIVTWHFAAPAAKRSGATRGDRRLREYRVPTRTTPAAGKAGATRGGIPGLAKVIEVISFPVAEAVGRGARFAVREWDVRNHPPLVRAYGPTGALKNLTPAAWKRLSDGPVLLWVHGTFSSTEGGFGKLPAATRKALDERYGGRVIAFDHPTIADDPIANARQFLEQAGDRALELDIVCHSRGGLVSRAIAERPGDLAGLAPNVRVRSVVLVGVPSNGTILAKADYWNQLVDRVTTLLSLAPAPGAVQAMETVLALVRSIAVRTAKNLKGLEAMAPGSAFLAGLNVKLADAGRYRAIVSDYEPKDAGWKEWLNDVARDAIFGQQPNDMMVAITSMTGENGSSRFPVKELQSFGNQDAVEHSMYFEQDGTTEALLRWLDG